MNSNYNSYRKGGEMATELAKLDELWVAEKPSNQAVVEKALRALGAHWINSSTSRADGYVLLNWKGKLIAVTSVFGHMLELVPPRGYESYQRYVEQSKELGRWDFFSFLPFFPPELLHVAKPELTRDGKPVTKNGQPVESLRLKIVEQLLRKAKEVVNACDIDREGQLIFDEIVIRRLKQDPTESRFKRIRIVDPGDKAMMTTVQTLEPNGSDFWVNLRASAAARAECDYLLGMNVSMAIQSLVRRERGAPAIGLGRVKIAIAVLVEQRDRQIAEFVAYDTYVPIAQLADRTQLRWFKRLGAETSPAFNSKGQLVDKVLADRIVADLARGQPGEITSASTEEKADAAPLPYSMGTLLVDASKKLDLTVQEVQELAQRLYEKHKLITYVGTDCQYLPENMHERAPEILDALRFATGAVPGLEKALEKVDASYKSPAFNDSKVDEHFAITPTGAEPVGLNDTEAALYGMIVNRYVAQFMGPYTYLSAVLTVQFGQDVFRALARKPTRPGWRSLSDHAIDDADGASEAVDVSRFQEGAKVQAAGARLDVKKVGPPSAFNQATLAEAMLNAHRYVRDEEYPSRDKAEEVRQVLCQTEGIGTSRTRASAIADVITMGLLIEAGAGKKRTVHISDVGRQTLRLLPPHLTSIAITAQWELLFSLVAKGQIPASAVIEQQKQLIKHVIKYLDDNRRAAA
ncbi:MAG: DNA topoisomerase III [Achromobacter sp.]|nr:DNA topoisomerase III [Achromobacter sp.]